MHPLLAVLVLLMAPAASWPVDTPHVVSGFRPPEAAWSAGHRGIDLAAATGDPVRAMAGGTVSFVGRIAGKPVVTVQHEGTAGLRSTYEPVVAVVAAGASVHAGDLLGTVAAVGGHCGGVAGCVHVGLRDSVSYRDPMSVLGRRPAVLKPWAAARSRPRIGRRARVRLGERGTQPLHRDMRVPLGRRQARVAQQLLDRAQVRAPLEHVRGRRVP